MCSMAKEEQDSKRLEKLIIGLEDLRGNSTNFLKSLPSQGGITDISLEQMIKWFIWPRGKTEVVNYWLSEGWYQLWLNLTCGFRTWQINYNGGIIKETLSQIPFW